MNLFPFNRQGVVRQQEIIETFEQARDHEPQYPPVSRRLAREVMGRIARQLGSLMIIAGVKLRDLYVEMPAHVESAAISAEDAICESPC